MRLTALFILFLTFSSTATACINEYRTLLTGEVVHTEARSGKIWTRKIDTTALRLEANSLLEEYKRTSSIKNYSDYAAALIYLGDYLQAKKIYEEIEKIQPNLYTTASNLGTIYELIGQPKMAYRWIKKSVEINPESHVGSEWIHLKILKFKIKGSENYSKSILGLYFGKEALPSNPKKYDLHEIEDHIRHQLLERSNFVKPKNKIVGSIYFDLGNIIAQTDDVQAALESYEAAIEYGFESELMNQRIIALEKLAQKAIPNQLFEKMKPFIRRNLGAIFGFGLLTFVLLLIFIPGWISRRRKRKLS